MKKRAMILAAGFGTRMGGLTQVTPKCLLEAGGKSMLEHVILRLKRVGVTEFVINLHHLADQIKNYIAEKKSFGAVIEFSYEPVIQDTGGGIKHMAKFMNGIDNFFVHNGDVYTELDLQKLWDFHQVETPIASIGVLRRPTSRPLIFSAQGKLIGWEGKEGKVGRTIATEPGERFNFSGIQIISRRLFDFMEEETGPFSIVTSYMKASERGENVHAYDMTSDFWLDVGTPERLAELRERLKK